MDYIVLDMEWNQPWPGSPSSKKPASSYLRGEIIQIGAVRVKEDGTVADEFQVMVKPKVFRHLNRRVSKRDQGDPAAGRRHPLWGGHGAVSVLVRGGYYFSDLGL